MKVKDPRGLLRSALGYVVRQKSALRGFLADGRLRMDNIVSERELTRISVGRNAWLFVGSDDHAQATANLFTLIASCKLHHLDPELYLRDLFRVLVHWPRDRYLASPLQGHPETDTRRRPYARLRRVFGGPRCSSTQARMVSRNRPALLEPARLPLLG